MENTNNEINPTNWERPNSFIFKVGTNEEPVIVIDEKGFWYKGELVEDAGEVYKLFREFIEGANA